MYTASVLFASPAVSLLRVAAVGKMWLERGNLVLGVCTTPICLIFQKKKKKVVNVGRISPPLRTSLAQWGGVAEGEMRHCDAR